MERGGERWSGEWEKAPFQLIERVSWKGAGEGESLRFDSRACGRMLQNCVATSSIATGGGGIKISGCAPGRPLRARGAHAVRRMCPWS